MQCVRLPVTTRWLDNYGTLIFVFIFVAKSWTIKSSKASEKFITATNVTWMWALWCNLPMQLSVMQCNWKMSGKIDLMFGHYPKLRYTTRQIQSCNRNSHLNISYDPSAQRIAQRSVMGDIVFAFDTIHKMHLDNGHYLFIVAVTYSRVE